MSDANKDDLANVCCHIVGSDLNYVSAEFEKMGFRRRIFDIIPGIAHDGQAASFVRGESGREQIHVVLYPSGDGFATAAHLEPHELLDPIGHISMVISGRSADYRAGAQRFQEALRWSGLSYRWTAH